MLTHATPSHPQRSFMALSGLICALINAGVFFFLTRSLDMMSPIFQGWIPAILAAGAFAVFARFTLLLSARSMPWMLGRGALRWLQVLFLALIALFFLPGSATDTESLRLLLLKWAAVALPLQVLGLYVLRRVAYRLNNSPSSRRTAVFFGMGPEACKLAMRLRRSPILGIHTAGYYAEQPVCGHPGQAEPPPYLGRYPDAQARIDAGDYGIAFVTLDERKNDPVFMDLMNRLYDSTAAIYLMPEDSELSLRNVVPANFLAPRHAGAHCTVMFSGTLRPERFYRDMLGLPAATAWVDVPAPFQAEQLAVTVAGHVSTRFRDRQRSVAPIGAIIARQYRERPGNYLAFLSSFDYARQVAEWLARHHPGLPVWSQTPGMGEGEREDFLARFVEGGQGVGFAVLGGAFSEGVDLPGQRLVGAFIATLGLPQLNPVNEAMMRLMARRFGAEQAYDYIYLYPGLRKVVQAAGRVIRAETDQGSVHLIDDRYRWTRVRRLLPDWWALPGG